VHGPFDTRIFQKQCKSLARAGYDTHLVVVHDADQSIDGVQINAIARTSNNRLSRMLGTVWQVYQNALRLDADIYHLHDPELIPVGLALKRRNKIVIFDSHEDYPADIMSKPWIPLAMRKHVAQGFAALERYALPKFDAVVTVHQQIAERLAKIQPNTVIVHNFPIIEEGYTPVETRIPKFVWLGLLSPIRGCVQIDVALKMTAGAALDVIGPVSKFQPNAERVTLLGSFPQRKAMEIAANYLAGLVTYLPEPNHIDALPNKLFEYMSLGLPVIASDFPKWRKIVEGAGCGLLVDPNSPESIAGAMRWMVDNPDGAAEMGRRGRAAVLEKYSWASEEKVLLNLYAGFGK
jgi:glycosyltransferase involved in cell wall biosynthesis